MPSRVQLLLLAALGLFAAGGSSCPQLVEQYTAKPPALPEQPSLSDVIATVNANAQRIESLSASDVTVQAPLVPSLKANLAYERPRKFRLVAETSLTGPEVDIGSNDRLFWVWVRRSQPRAMFYCRHDQFASSRARKIVPIEPQWLVEALGAVWLDPNLPHHGPYERGSDQLEIHTPVPGPEGTATRVTVVDRGTGWVVGQHLYGPDRKLLAWARMSEHQLDPLTQVVLPQQIELHYAATDTSLKITVRDWMVNLPAANNPERWQMPQYDGWPPLDLAAMGRTFQGGGAGNNPPRRIFNGRRQGTPPAAPRFQR